MIFLCFSIHSCLLMFIDKDSQWPPVTERTFPVNSGIQGWITAEEEWNPLTNEDKEEEVQKSNSELFLKMYHQDNKLKFSEKDRVSCEYKLLVNGRKETSWHLWTCKKHLVLATVIPNLCWHTEHSDTLHFRWQVARGHFKNGGLEVAGDVSGF